MEVELRRDFMWFLCRCKGYSMGTVNRNMMASGFKVSRLARKSHVSSFKFGVVGITQKLSFSCSCQLLDIIAINVLWTQTSHDIIHPVRHGSTRWRRAVKHAYSTVEHTESKWKQRVAVGGVQTIEVSVIRKADSETLGKVAQAVTEQACLPLLTWKILALVRLFLL